MVIVVVYFNLLVLKAKTYIKSFENFIPKWSSVKSCSNIGKFYFFKGFSAVPSRVGQKRPGQPGEEDSPEGKRIKMD
jgi:hypothetical protein